MGLDGCGSGQLPRVNTMSHTPTPGLDPESDAHGDSRPQTQGPLVDFTQLFGDSNEAAFKSSSPVLAVGIVGHGPVECNSRVTESLRPDDSTGTSGLPDLSSIA